MKKRGKKGYVIGVTVALITLVGIGFYLMQGKEFAYNGEELVYEGKLIQDVYTDLGRYEPSSDATVTIEIKSTVEEDITGQVHLVLKDGDEQVKAVSSDTITVKKDESHEMQLAISLPETDFKGYLVETWFASKDGVYDLGSTAIDVSSDWTKFPRYGYLSMFENVSNSTIEYNIERLNKFHINGIQYYDWQYKHQQPVAFKEDGSLAEEWNEIANRPIEKKVVDAYIAKTHEKKMAAMNYNLIFGAWEDYEKDGVKPEWGAYKDTKGEKQDFHPLPSDWASTKIYLFDPLNPEWQDFIINKEQEVFDNYGFDGWHIDQLGDRGRLFNYEGKGIQLGLGYADLIRKGKEKLNKSLVFNAVGGYGQSVIAVDNKVDFLYTEVWETNSYAYLKSYIDEGYRYSKNQLNMVLAAYMNYKVKGGDFNKHAVLLTDAVIFASGGSHIELGDSGMLSHEYFPNDKLKVSDELNTALREYYDFMVAYQNYLRDGQESIKPKIESESLELSTRPSNDKVWYFAKKKENVEVLQLINFSGVNNMNWRDDTGTKAEPTVQENFDIKYYIEGEVKKVSVATPDANQSRMLSLDFEKGSDTKGSYIKVNVPKLYYWDMLVIEK